MDFDLALKAPSDEQRTMARVGLALLLGAAFHGLCVVVAMRIMLGDGVWQVAISTVVAVLAASIIFAFDSLLVAHDWIAQGRSFCRARGILRGSRLAPWSRILIIILRWGMSFAVASLAASFVLLGVFAADIVRDLAREHRNANAHIVARIESRHEELADDARRQIKSLDSQVEGLQKQRAALTDRITTEPPTDKNTVDFADDIAALRKQLAETKNRASEFETLADAEEHGVAWTEKSTGRPKKGDAWTFYDKQAQHFRARASSLEADIAAKEKTLEQARRSALAAAEGATKAAADSVAAIDKSITELLQRRSNKAAELKALVEGRESWIRAHAQQVPGFVPISTALSDRLRVLWVLMQKSELILSIAFALKGFIIILESAGPLAKTLFSSSGLYAMRAAMRIEDAVDDEIERREAKDHAVFLRRRRRQERDEEPTHRQYPEAASPDRRIPDARNRESSTVE